MPSQTFVVLGVEDDSAELRYDDWQIIDALVLLHCATTPESPKPILMTCLAESTLHAFAQHPKIIIGDPACERLELPYPEQVNIATSDSSCLKTRFLVSLGIKALAVEEGESLIIILCGHGNTEGNFLIGSGEGVCRQLSKEELQVSVAACKGKVTLISTTRHSGLWTSDCWDLVAAAPADQESNSIVESDSQAGVAMPHPGVTTHNVNESCTTCPLTAPLSSPTVDNIDILICKMNAFRVSINRSLYCAPFQHHGQKTSIFPSNAPTMLSIAPLTKVKPSSSTHYDGQSGILQSVPTVMQSYSESLVDTPWTLVEEQEMENLAIAVKQQVLAPTPSNNYIVKSATWFLAGGEDRKLVQSVKFKKPLVSLRKHETLRAQAKTIAYLMGWDINIDPEMAVGPIDAAIIQEATIVGQCNLKVVTFEGKWQEPAYWLARLWKAAGGVAVDRSTWDNAVASAQQQSYNHTSTTAI